jgi:glycosyltransferase involved in cell wall biosynthesis
MSRVIIIGPAFPLRGGLATFDQRLAKQFNSEGSQCSIISFKLQYPSLLFPGKTQYSDEEPPANIIIYSWINSINPLNWIITGNRIKRLRPDLIVVRFWIPFMGPSLGTILRRVRRNKHSKIICIADNVIPHEKRTGDRPFTSYFLKSCDAFITMSEKVMNDLKHFEQNKPAKIVRHPLYDNFGEIISKEQSRNYLNLNLKEKIILFFGFIRNYKGLDLLLKAMEDAVVQKQNIKLLVAGEFYEDEKPYYDLIKQLSLENSVILRTHFIADSEVKYYLCAADCVIQPYRNATQSGVTPLAYHFEKPMIVTNVGGLPTMVPDKRSGLVCQPEPESIAKAIVEFYQLGENYFIPHLREEKNKYSWHYLTKAIVDLSHQVKEK